MSDEPRVLFLDHSGALGGAELYLIDVVKRLSLPHRTVTLQEGGFAERLRSEGIVMEVIEAPAPLLDVERETGLWKSFLSIPAVLATVAAVARRLRDFDLLYANSQKALIVGGLAGWFARRPVVWNLHDILTADHFSAFNRRLGIWWSRLFVDRVVTNSNATRAAFIEAGGEAGKAHVVYNGIDAAVYDGVAGEEAERAREELGLGDVPVVGVFSRLAPWKGQHVLLEALEGLDGVHALLVGEPLFAPDREYAEALRRLARRDGLSGRVHFLGFREDVPRLMRMVDVVAHTSVAPEPFGRVIVEGMLARRPVVATRAGGALELVEEGVTGRLVEPGDAGALRTALRELLDGEEAARLGARAYEHARKRFCPDAVTGEIERHLREVATGRSHHLSLLESRL